MSVSSSTVESVTNVLSIFARRARTVIKYFSNFIVFGAEAAEACTEQLIAPIPILKSIKKGGCPWGVDTALDR